MILCKKFNPQKINQKNVEIITWILNSECLIIERLMQLDQSPLLCSTLMLSNLIRLSNKFVEKDMSVNKADKVQSLIKAYCENSPYDN